MAAAPEIVPDTQPTSRDQEVVFVPIGDDVALNATTTERLPSSSSQLCSELLIAFRQFGLWRAIWRISLDANS